MSGEYDAIDAMIERAAREEQEELNRARGQQILNMVAAQRESASDLLLEAISRAHQAKAEADRQ
jgi:myo-inositol catabolism protein IolC